MNHFVSNISKKIKNKDLLMMISLVKKAKQNYLQSDIKSIKILIYIPSILHFFIKKMMRLFSLLTNFTHNHEGVKI